MFLAFRLKYEDFYIRSHFRWESIQKFIYLAHAFSTTCSSFDMFSKVLVVKVHVFEYIIYTIFIGISYMFMDFFIKQYSRRLDTNKHLNPLLRGISFGILLQTALWTILHASDLADSLRYFFISMNASPNWSKCKNIRANITCMPSQDIVVHCDYRLNGARWSHASNRHLAPAARHNEGWLRLQQGHPSDMWDRVVWSVEVSGGPTLMAGRSYLLSHDMVQVQVLTEAPVSGKYLHQTEGERPEPPPQLLPKDRHDRIHRLLPGDWQGQLLRPPPRAFSNNDKHSLSTRLFVIAIVWIGNFFITTITDSALLTIFKFSFIWGTFSTAFILIFLLFSTKYTIKAFYDIMDIKDFFHRNAFNLISDPFGVGLIGVYDFGTMSPFTMIDNAVIIFAIVFVVSAFARSLIVRVLYLVLTNCVDTKVVETPHYLLFAILPLSTEFMNAHKIFIVYIYSYMTTALVACLAMFTSIISRLLHSEFRSVKNIYIVGLFCFLGFNLSLPLSTLTKQKMRGIMYGLNTCSLYFGGVKVAIVMWLYGVQTFSTDIHFWLGFKPTQFWKCIWAMLPVVIMTILCINIISIKNLNDESQKGMAFTWIALSLLIQLIINSKMIAKYIMRNNLVGIFKSNFKYGPPEIDDRKRRKYFDEIAESRQCQHNCMVLDEGYECNHMPLIYKSRSNISSNESSLTNIYEGPSGKRTSSVIDVSVLHTN
ncbi:uncharacterized protein LOC123668898 [Melitaea cinxia]|uniref:uncharacterized protein LOC123668898 n=1 Tax=Melitaea cinxia TaxID=113334 RepID=UPI001E270885|nr:uncharacterized protein LOC123668898 [Melitaea cinxia]